MEPKLTVVYHVASVGAAFVAALAFLVYALRSKSNALLADESEKLAVTRGRQIEDLERRVASLETKLQALEEENESLRRINLRLQRQLGYAS